MRESVTFFHLVLFVTLVSVAYSQSLADLAKKEKLRRDKITNARVITAEEAAKYITKPNIPEPVSDQPTAKEDSEETGSEIAIKAQPEKTDPDEPLDFFGRPESYWRKTMSEARQRVKDLENEKNVLILKQNRLENEFYREDNGFKREGIQREIQKTFYEQDLNREDLRKARDALEDLEKEARKSGALPGWISGR